MIAEERTFFNSLTSQYSTYQWTIYRYGGDIARAKNGTARLVAGLPKENQGFALQKLPEQQGSFSGSKQSFRTLPLYCSERRINYSFRQRAGLDLVQL
jgi:hypothetical protein